MRFVQVEFPNSALARRENNSCTVYAVATVLGVDYDEAHALLKAHGRKTRRGASIWLQRLALTTRGTVREVPIPAPPPKLQRCGHYSFDKRDRYPTAARFLCQLPRRGRFVLSAGHHSFAFVDGVLYDNNARPKTRARIYSAMEFIPRTGRQS